MNNFQKYGFILAHGFTVKEYMVAEALGLVRKLVADHHSEKTEQGKAQACKFTYTSHLLTPARPHFLQILPPKIVPPARD